MVFGCLQLITAFTANHATASNENVTSNMLTKMSRSFKKIKEKKTGLSSTQRYTTQSDFHAPPTTKKTIEKYIHDIMIN